MMLRETWTNMVLRGYQWQIPGSMYVNTCCSNIHLLNISTRDHYLMSATRKALPALLECMHEERVYCRVCHLNLPYDHTSLNILRSGSDRLA